MRAVALLISLLGLLACSALAPSASPGRQACGGLGRIHLVVFWAALGPKETKRGIRGLQSTPGVTVLEVHTRRWPAEESVFAQCHRAFYANNHAEKGFTVPPKFLHDDFVSRVKGTGPFTVVVMAVECSAAGEAVTAPCGEERDCDNAPKSPMLLSLKKHMRKTLSRPNKYAIHTTVNGREAEHDITSLFGTGYHDRMDRKATQRLAWDGTVRHDDKATCVAPLQPPG